MPKKCNRGFSLVEIVVALALMSLAIGSALFYSMDSYRSQSFYTDRDALVSLLQHARAEAMNNVCAGSNCSGGTPHGVYIESNRYVLFQGASYITRDGAQDSAIDASPLVTQSGSNEIVFERESGTVLNPGVIHLSDAAGHDSIITIKAEGQISWTH